VCESVGGRESIHRGRIESVCLCECGREREEDIRGI
jgi:hypothetical protein